MSGDFFEYWLSNIAMSLQFIADTNAVCNVWVHGVQNITSAYCINELLEQLLGDLHLPEEIIRFEDELRRIGALEEIRIFSDKLVSLEREIKDDPRLEHPESLLASQAWQDIQAAAMRVVQLPSVKSFIL